MEQPGEMCIRDRDMTGKKILGVPVVADKDNMVSYIQKNWVDEVFFKMCIRDRRYLGGWYRIGQGSRKDNRKPGI